MATESYVPITPGTGAFVDTFQLVNASSQTVNRQVVVIGDPSSVSGALPVDSVNGIPVQVKQFPNGVTVTSAFTAWQATPFVNLLAAPIVIKATPGVLGGYFLHNPTAATAVVNVYDSATAGAVTVGSTPAKLILSLAAGASANLEFVRGISFTNGVVIAATTATSGNTAPASALDGFLLTA
jgi:hypothetical protein